MIASVVSSVVNKDLIIVAVTKTTASVYAIGSRLLDKYRQRDGPYHTHNAARVIHTLDITNRVKIVDAICSDLNAIGVQHSKSVSLALEQLHVALLDIEQQLEQLDLKITTFQDIWFANWRGYVLHNDLEQLQSAFSCLERRLNMLMTVVPIMQLSPHT